MANTVDARGLSCPQPVLMTLDEIKAGNVDEIVVMVDNEASKENVSRAAQSKGWKLKNIQEKDGIYHITIGKE
ncbi:MAG: sulfurtransferase TusA family protein [Deltaproteobacteria bacterium]|nr:sulfurtransferase TusA family protein [Deltaproteobacteria bacterium]